MSNILTSINNITASINTLYEIAGNEQDRESQKSIYSEIDILNAVASRLNRMPITTGQDFKAVEPVFSEGLFGSETTQN